MMKNEYEILDNLRVARQHPQIYDKMRLPATIYIVIEL